MTQGSGRQKLGLVACAFDASGREVLNALVSYPGLRQQHVHAYHAVEQDGVVTWFRNTQGGQWDQIEWPSSTWLQGLEVTVKDALDVTRWRTREGGLDLLDLVLLNPVMSEGFGTLPPEVVSALPTLRRRYRKISRILLLVDGRFEVFGEGAPPGVLQLLPYANGSDGGSFDAVILMDRVNLEGMVINDSELVRKHAAAVLVHLTLGDLAPSLYRRIQTEKARLGELGRYLALGLAEWRLTRDLGIESTATLLYRRIAERLLAPEAASPEGPILPPDPWVEEVTEELLRYPEKGQSFPREDPSAMVDLWDRRGCDSLRSTLVRADWGLSLLEPFLERRLAALKRLKNRTALGLAVFMDSIFARWFVKKYLGKPSGEERPKTRDYDVQILTGKKWACALLSVACLGGIGLAVGTNYPVAASIFAGACSLSAALLAVTGFERKIPKIAPLTILPDDPMPELEFRRKRDWVAQELAGRCERTLASWREQREQIRREKDSLSGDSADSFPFSPEVCSSFLEEKALDAAAILRHFWDKAPAALAATIGKTEQTLPEILRDFSRRCCEPFADLEWSDIFRAIGGERGLEDPAWREELERARAGALPWLPVAGSSLQTFLALPGRLPAELKSAFSRQFPDQKVVEEIEGSEILVLQLSQGYRLPSEPQMLR
jgi:hypothetical protein